MMNNSEFIKTYTLDILEFIASLFVLIVAPMLSIVGVVQLLDVMLQSPPTTTQWLLTIPAIYFAWLIGVLLIYVVINLIAALRQKKPDYIETQSNLHFKKEMILPVFLYMRMRFLFSLPLVEFLSTIPFFRVLVLRSYGFGCSLGKRVRLLGKIDDPELTTLDDDVLIGTHARLVSHSYTIEPNNINVFHTAPIYVGARTSIGGDVLIQLGVNIGNDVLIEAGSVIAPYTQIGDGEIWGGIPAVKTGMRSGFESLKPFSNQVLDFDKELVPMVSSALNVTEINMQTCAEQVDRWDSLGTMAIAAALYNRYGLSVPGRDLPKLQSMQAIVEYLQAARQDSEVSINDNELLPLNPELLPLLDYRLVTKKLALSRYNSNASISCKVCIAASFPAEPLESSLKLWANAYGIDAEVSFCGFNQSLQELLSPDSFFYHNTEGINVVLIRSEDFIQSSDAENLFQQYQKAIQYYLNNAVAPLVVMKLFKPLVMKAKENISILIDNWQNMLDESNVLQLDIQDFVTEVGTILAANDDKKSVIPFSDRLYQRLGIEVSRIVRSVYKPPIRVVALDCDNTLWGGIIGEDHIDGIQLGNSEKGDAFVAFQKKLLALKNTGVLLTLLSKNNEQDVWDVFENHPEMVLTRKDISCSRINWQLKSINLKEIADSLNLALDSFLVIDDSPQECLEISTAYPQVAVLPLPADPEYYVDTLAKLWAFDKVMTTHEDRARTLFIQQDSERTIQQDETANLKRFLSDLNLQITVRAANECDLSRVAQLIQKTNQLNLNLHRRTLGEISKLMTTHMIRVLEAKDRFGDYGMVGVAIIKASEDSQQAQLDTFLLSCRALGRGIEQTFLCTILNELNKLGYLSLRADFQLGPRNQSVSTVFTHAGFNTTDKNIWILQPINPGHISEHIELMP